MLNIITTFIPSYPALFIIIIVVVALIFLSLLRQYNLFMFKQYKRKISQYYSEDELIVFLGRDKIVFPVLGQIDKIPLRSLNVYKKDYMYGSVLAIPMGAGFQQGYIIDKKGKKYKLIKMKLSGMGLMINEIRNLVFERVELVEGEVVDFQSMKDEILQEIKKEGKRSAYFDIEDEIQNVKSLEELTELMDSIPH